MKFFNDARLRAGAMFREFREKREEAKAEKAKQADPAGVTVPLWLVQACKFAAWVATISLMYFLWLYTLDIARDRSASLHITHAGTWIGDLQFWFPHIVGFAVVAFGIPYVAKIAIPTFVSLSWRQDPTAKAWSLGIAVAVSLVVIAGTFTVQGHNIMERDRDAAVAVEGVQQEAAVLAARIADVQHAMDERTQSPSQYVRTAASMSPAAYDRFVAARVGDPQYQRLASYRAVSEEMVDLNRQMSDLRAQQARQTAVSSVQREVVTERTGWIAQTLGWLEGVRAILLSFVMDIVALIMPLIALRLEQARNRQLATGRDLHPSMLLEDHVGEAAYVDLTPGEAARAVFNQGGTREEAEAAAREAMAVPTKRRKYEDLAGQDITDYVEKNGRMVKMPKRDPRTGKFTATMEVPARDPGPEDKGVTDPSRTGVTLGGRMEGLATADHAVDGEPERADVGNSNSGGDAVKDDLARARHEEGRVEQPADTAEYRGGDDSSANVDLQPDLPELPDLPDLTNETEEESQNTEPENTVQQDNAETDQREELTDRAPETRDERLLPPVTVAAE